MPRRRARYSDGMSQPEVARLLGCTRENVSRLERAAIRKVRERLQALGIDGPAVEPEGFLDQGEDE